MTSKKIVTKRENSDAFANFSIYIGIENEVKKGVYCTQVICIKMINLLLFKYVFKKNTLKSNVIELVIS